MAEILAKKKFRTKTGYCHILEDKIVFTPRGFIGKMGDLTVEGRMYRVLLIFGGIAALVLYFAYDNYMKKEQFWALLFGLIGAYLIFGIIKGLNSSIYPIIERSQITEVKFTKAVDGLTLPSFEIKFKNEKGKIKTRNVSLPGKVSKYPSELKIALKIMREEGLID